MRQTRFHRIVGILLVILALSDISLCNPCEEELNCPDAVSVSFSDLSSTVKSRVLSDSDNVKIVSTDSSKNSENHRISCIDCFCCVQVLPSEAIPFDCAVERQILIDFTISFLPSSPSQDTYHPPRFA